MRFPFGIWFGDAFDPYHIVASPRFADNFRGRERIEA
jgi:hypothetical protein